MASYLTAPINLTAAGDATLVPADPRGRRIAVFKAFAVGKAEVDVTFKSGSANSLTGPMCIPAKGNGLVIADDGSPFVVTSPGEALVANLSTSTVVGGAFSYKYID